MFLLFILAMAILFPASPAPAPDTRPVCSTDVVVAYGDEPIPCNVNPPTLLVVVLDDNVGDTQGECDDMGGRTMYDERIDRFYCIGVDY